MVLVGQGEARRREGEVRHLVRSWFSRHHAFAWLMLDWATGSMVVQDALPSMEDFSSLALSKSSTARSMRPTAQTFLSSKSPTTDGPNTPMSSSVRPSRHSYGLREHEFLSLRGVSHSRSTCRDGLFLRQRRRRRPGTPTGRRSGRRLPPELLQGLSGIFKDGCAPGLSARLSWGSH